jgi:hypothetical protein
MQSKKHSLFEALFNVVSGILLSVFVIQPWAFKFYNIHLTHTDNLTLALLFTIVSFVRSYIIRRSFNWLHHKSQK